MKEGEGDRKKSDHGNFLNYVVISARHNTTWVTGIELNIQSVQKPVDWVEAEEERVLEMNRLRIQRHEEKTHDATRQGDENVYEAVHGLPNCSPTSLEREHSLGYRKQFQFEKFKYAGWKGAEGG